MLGEVTDKVCEQSCPIKPLATIRVEGNIEHRALRSEKPVSKSIIDNGFILGSLKD
jgi:hypothetical protein